MDVKGEMYNFFLIQKLLMEATKLSRNIFQQTWKQKKKTEWTNDEESGNFFNTNGGETILKAARENQKAILESGNSNAWDLTIFGMIFSNKPFKSNEKSTHIKTLRDKRNEIFHNPSFNLTDKEFLKLWEEISNAMIQLGYSKLNLDKIKTEFDKEKILTNISNENKANLIKIEANKAFKEESYEEALRLYDTAITLPGLSDEVTSILYCNRSLAYLKLYQSSSNKIDQRNLTRALNDAQMACDLNQKWFKAYLRLAQTYRELNDLEKSIENFRIALLLDPTNEELKNLLAEVRFIQFEQNRYAHLDQDSMPRTTEERSDHFFTNKGEQVGHKKEKWDNSMNKSAKAAVKNDPILADVWLAHEYRDGSKNVKQNYEMAAKYYGKAAAAGNAEGLYNLALLHKNGLGVQKDFNKAFQFLKQAAQKEPTRKLCGLEIPNVGVAEAEHSIAILYQSGIFVEKDISKAVFWYKRAIEHGSKNSANNLGLIYSEGKGIARDLDQAERLFLLSHKLGDNNSITNLVELYLVRNQPDKALLWHEIAMQNNSLYDCLRDDEIREKIKFQKSMNAFKIFQEEPKEFLDKKSILTDPHRISLIKDHRKSISMMRNVDQKNEFLIQNTFKPPRKQLAPYSIKNFKEVKFNEINFTKDHVLEGFKLLITIIDLPIMGFTSIMFLVEDDNKFIERMAVYNLEKDNEKIHKIYPIGSQFMIVNPYIRMAADGKPMIRIDDPNTLLVTGTIKEKVCRFCGALDSKFQCGKCTNAMTKAMYCSKECQINDWKILDHKLICL